jgi:hypothetical protein
MGPGRPQGHPARVKGGAVVFLHLCHTLMMWTCNLFGKEIFLVKWRQIDRYMLCVLNGKEHFHNNN